jgi:hypothetical protein
MKDLELINPELFEMVKEESLRQIRKWGIQEHDSFEWLAFTTEEHGELSKAISEWYFRRGLISDVVKEAIQEATLCLKIAEMFMALDYHKSNSLCFGGKDGRRRVQETAAPVLEVGEGTAVHGDQENGLPGD